MAQQIQLRRGTAAEWTSANPILAEGEKGIETDTGQEKTGDGVTAWVSLPYFGGTGSGEGDLLSTNNLSDLDDVSVARTNLGLGTAAEEDVDAFQAASAVLDAVVSYVSVTQAVDLDVIESRVNALDAAVILQGSWDASAGTFPGGGTAQAGSSWIVSVGGTVNGQVFVANDRIVALTDNASTSTYASNWLKLDYTDQVLSVAGLTGAITDSALRTALGLVIGTDVQAHSSELVALAALSGTAYGRNLITLANQEALQTAVGLSAEDVPVVDSGSNYVGNDVETILTEIAGELDTLVDKADLVSGLVPENQTPTLIINKTIIDFGGSAPNDGVWVRYAEAPPVEKTVLHVGSFVTSASVASGNIVLTADVAVGDVLVVSGAVAGSGRTLSVSDSEANTWDNSNASSTSPGTPALHTELFRCNVTNPLVAGDTITVTITGGSTGLVAHAARLTDYDGTEDANPTNSGSTDNNTLTTVAANNLSVVFASIGTQSNRPIDEFDVAWTQLAVGTSTGAASNPFGALYYIQIETAASVTFDFGMDGGGSQWAAVQLELT